MRHFERSTPHVARRTSHVARSTSHGRPSISLTFPRTIRRSTRCSRRPTRLASSRSSRARRWRRCRASSRPASTTSSSRWRSSARARSSGRWCIPYLNRRAGREPVALPPSVARADPGANAGRAALSGAAAAHGDGGRRIHRRAGRGAAPGLWVQAIRAADEADRGAAARRHGPAGHQRRRRRSDRHVDHARSRSTDFPSPTPRASRCSPMPARISRCITRRRSTRRSSTTSPWGSIIRRRSSRTPSAAASVFIRSTCRCPTGTARWKRTARSDWDCDM